jgi:nitric oxide reductase NorD protein
MGAPTWPPDPQKAFAETAREYGVRPRDIGADADDEEFEHALLAAFLHAPPRFRLAEGAESGTPLHTHQRALAAWLALISGDPVELAASDPPATDGRRVFLPVALPAPARPEDAALFRAMALTQIGLLRFGLLEGEGLLKDLYRDWVLRSCYHLLATRLVLARWAACLPGVARDLRALPRDEVAGRMRINLTEVPREGMPGAFLPLYAGLVAEPTWGTPGAEADLARAAVAAVRALPAPVPGAWGRPVPPAEQAAARAVLLGQAHRLRQHYRRLRLGPPPLPFFAGVLRPEWLLARAARDPGAEEAWREGPSPLRRLRAAQARATPTPGPSPSRPSLRGRLKASLGRALRSSHDPEELRRAPAYGALRDEHQRQADPAMPARWSPDLSVEDVLAQAGGGLAEAALPGVEEGTRHDEWDDHLQAYLLGATRVIERPAPSGPLASHARLVAANGRRIAEVRRRFEALRLEERWLHGQLDGPDLDLDRAVTAWCDLAAGQDPDPRVFLRWQRQRQPVALLVLVDLSGSTQGHVVHLEQEALVLLAEGLRALRFPHALFGFHDDGPEACWLERFKGFDEGYGEPVFKRISNLQPGGATRLGAFLRHGASLLARRPEVRRVLLVLSDGKPHGQPPYQGAWGVRDSAMAVQEGARLGVHTFCVSLDAGHDAPDYLSRIFGPGRFLALTQVDQLPARLPEVLRRLVR